MVEVRVVGSARERRDAFAVRHAVFVEEQGIDEAAERDGRDAAADHVVAYDSGEPVGVARLRELGDGVGKVERVAVLASRREEGLGRSLVAAVERRARTLGLSTLVLHSQTRVAPFYAALGYERRGDEFEEAGIPHVEMRKRLE